MSPPPGFRLPSRHTTQPTRRLPRWAPQKEELERMATTLKLGEKGMVRVQGIFEQSQAPQ